MKIQSISVVALIVITASLLILTAKSSLAEEQSCHGALDDIPTVQLSNGVQMPLLLTGTAQLSTQAGSDPTLPPRFIGMIPELSYRQIELALQNGVRAFDTAHIYRTARQIGSVLGEWWRTGQLADRRDVWITTKIFHPNATDITFGITQMEHMSEMTPDQVRSETRKQLERSLMDLGVGYVDLMLLHWPSELGKGSSKENRKRRLAAWQVLEDAYENKGWLRAIGVSNFSPRHLEDLIADGAKVRPMVNQFEASILLQHKDILKYCLEHDIVPQAYSPLGRGIKDLPPLVSELATKYGKDMGQIAIRYLVQLGYSVTYLTNSEKRLVSNRLVFDFELTEKEMSFLDGLSRPDGGWGLPNPLSLD